MPISTLWMSGTACAMATENPMRRAAEQEHVSGLTQLGIRNVSSTSKDGYEAARSMGSDILSVRQVRRLGVQAVLERIPEGRKLLSDDRH